MTIPNALSTLRLLLAPLLVYLAWTRAADAFTWTLALSLLTDIIDGKVARWLGQTSRLGAVLDSAADLATYSVVPVCAVWLKPELVRRETIAFWLTVWCYLFPVLVGFVRFRRLTSYHARAGVLSAYLMGASALTVFLFDTAVPWRLALPVLVYSALENLAITAVLPAWQPNVPSLARALAIRRATLGKAAPVSAGG